MGVVCEFSGNFIKTVNLFSKFQVYSLTVVKAKYVPDQID